MSSHHQHQPVITEHPYTLPRDIDFGDLMLVAGIEAPCRGLMIHFEDWARCGFPVWCGLTPVYPVGHVPERTIAVMREAA